MVNANSLSPINFLLINVNRDERHWVWAGLRVCIVADVYQEKKFWLPYYFPIG